MLITPFGYRIAVRFARKPIWMPTAPTKLFRMSVLTREFYDNEEVEQIKKLQAVYNSQMESISNFMRVEFYEPASKAGGIPAEFLQMEAEEDKKINEENDRLNAEIAKQKAEFFAERLRYLEDEVINEKLKREDAIIEASQKVDDYIKSVKDKPDACVTPDNFEALMIKALENPVNHEFCIDTYGRKYESEPPQILPRKAKRRRFPVAQNQRGEDASRSVNDAIKDQ